MSGFDSIKLVDYSRKEDWVNSITHMLGAVFALVVIALCVNRGIERNRIDYILLSIVYGVTMLTVFVCSSVASCQEMLHFLTIESSTKAGKDNSG